jgi:hypothetical protein
VISSGKIEFTRTIHSTNGKIQFISQSATRNEGESLWRGRSKEETHDENVLAKNRPNDPVTGYPALMRNSACRLEKI